MDYTVYNPLRHFSVCNKNKPETRCKMINQVSCFTITLKVNTITRPSTPSLVLSIAATRCHYSPSILLFPSSSIPLQTADSLSNRKQMGDFCCRLQPNGANSHYNVCKLCLCSPSFTSTPCTTILPSDVFDTCFRHRRLIFRCPVLLITGYLHNRKHT